VINQLLAPNGTSAVGQERTVNAKIKSVVQVFMQGGLNRSI
jgi:hypothetical protein